MDIRSLIDKAMKDHQVPRTIVCAPTPYAMLTAYQKFEGRDWRRIKREMNKAAIKARKATLTRSAALDELGKLDGELLD